MHGQWLTSTAALHQRAAEWDAALDASASENPFLRSDFLLCWIESFVPDGDLRVFVLHDHDRLVGGLPLFLKRRRRAPHWPVLHAVGVDFANVTEPFFTVTANVFWEHCRQALLVLPGWRWLRLPWMRAALAPPFGVRIEVGANAAIDIDRGAADYIAGRGRLGPNLRRHLRRAAERGGLELRQHLDPAEAVALARRHFEFRHALGRLDADRSGHSQVEWEAFVLKLVARLAERGRLDAFSFRIGEETAAIYLGLRQGPGLKGVLFSYNAAFADCGPGMLLVYHLVDWCWTHGVPEYEMYSGREPYKGHWCNRHTPVYDVRLAHADPLGRLALAAHRLRAWLFF